MFQISAFPAHGQWYQGNTHAHTNRSDGRLSPEALVEAYRQLGYDFTAITDHRIYSDFDVLEQDDFIVLPGIELDVPAKPEEAICHHLVGLGIPGENRFSHDQKVVYDKSTTAFDLQKILAANGQLCIYAHPGWSHARHEVLPAFSGLWAMEVYNHTCEVNSGCGESTSYYDRMLWHGKRLWCLACDDTHQNAGPDLGGGFIRVKAAKLSREAIFAALRQGHFYASQGPRIDSFMVQDQTVYLETSACRTLAIQNDSDPGHAQTRIKGDLKSLEYTLTGKEAYVRAVLIDATGRKAWSQPLWLSGTET